jgi:hypothetical protein
MQLQWIKCTGDIWCPLGTVNLSSSHFDNMNGVYVIWHGGSNAATVYVGKGNIKERLAQHRNDNRIQHYSNLGLYVTWASVAPPSLDGVEIYLANKLNPKIGEAHPNATPIEVNLPW